MWSLGRWRWALERKGEGGCWDAMCCAENAGWKKSRDTCGWHSLPASPSQSGKQLWWRTGIVCSPQPGVKREEAGVVWISLSIFCPYFLEFEHRCLLPKAIARDRCLGCCSEHCWVSCISDPVTRTWKPHWWLWQSHGFYSSVTHFQRTWILKLFVQSNLRPECSGCLIPVG